MQGSHRRASRLHAAVDSQALAPARSATYVRLLVAGLLIIGGCGGGGGGDGGGSGFGPSNTAPIANAGPDSSVSVGLPAQLDGSGSTDLDGDLLTFQWALRSRPTGSSATLSDPTAIRPAFTPDLPGTYVFQLEVSDGSATSPPDLVTFSTLNSAPTANAGPDQTIPIGGMVQLDGTASRDPDGDALTYQWILTSRPAGSSAAVAPATAADPTLVPDVAGRYTVSLVVSDGVASSAPDAVVISTQNSAPVANAGPDKAVIPGDIVALDGSASSDFDGDSLSYSWALIARPAGSAAKVASAALPIAALTPDVAGTYLVQLIVNDGQLASAPDTMAVVASAPVAVLRFGQSPYVVASGQTFPVTVLLDSDFLSPVADPLADGLFSYGIKLVFEPTAASVNGASAITVPAELDFNGFSAGAQKATGSGFAAVKGTIAPAAVTAYNGTLIATFEVTDLGTGQPYALGLEIYRTLGPNEAVFLDGEGTVLDGGIVFETADVNP